MTRRRRRKHPKPQIRRKGSKAVHRTHRRRRRAVRRRPAVVSAMPEQGSPDTPAAPRDARIRLDGEERAAIIEAFAASLPKTIRKALKEQRIWEIDWKLRDKHKLAIGLIRRLQAPRRGHPSTW